MKTLIAGSVLIAMSSMAYANNAGNTGAVFGISYIPFIENESQYALENTDDHMLVFSFSGVNAMPDNKYFMNSGLFFNFGLSQHAYQKRDFDFKEHKMFNLGLTFPVSEGFYTRVGGGVYWRNTVVNGENVEEERLLNAHFGAGYFITDRLTTGLTYDTGVGNVGFEIGFQF